MVGMWKAFDEMERIGWVQPQQAAAHGVGAGRGLRADRPRVRSRAPRRPQPWEGARRVADGLRVPRAIGDFLILRAVRESGGTALAVSDRRWWTGMLRHRASTRASAPRPKAAPRSAAIARLVADGSIKPHDTVVLFNTGGALKYLDVLQ